MRTCPIAASPCSSAEVGLDVPAVGNSLGHSGDGSLPKLTAGMSLHSCFATLHTVSCGVCAWPSPKAGAEELAK